MITKKDLFLLGIIGLLVVAIMVQTCDKPKAEPVVRYEYKTDTTVVNQIYKTLRQELKKFEKKWDTTPPKVVTYYITQDPKNVTIEKVPDSLILWIQEINSENDSLRLAISDNYLKNNVRSDKLIDFKLTRDSLDITTLNIKGETLGKNFPLYLNEFDYYWEDNNLYHQKTENPFNQKGPSKWKNLFIEGGYEYFFNAPQIGLEYYVHLGRFKIETEASTIFLQNPLLYGNVTVGYRLFK